MASFYDMSAKDLEGNTVNFGDFKGKVCIVTNVACNCGYTNSNYKELVALHNKYRDQGLEVLAFPCNQFGAQEPGSPAQIKDFVSKYGVSFKMMEKVDVNGPKTHPVWAYLKSACDTCGGDVTWNFKAKFIVDKNGNVVQRNGNPPAASETLIQQLLAA